MHCFLWVLSFYTLHISLIKFKICRFHIRLRLPLAASRAYIYAFLVLKKTFCRHFIICKQKERIGNGRQKSFVLLAHILRSLHRRSGDSARNGPTETTPKRSQLINRIKNRRTKVACCPSSWPGFREATQGWQGVSYPGPGWGGALCHHARETQRKDDGPVKCTGQIVPVAHLLPFPPSGDTSLDQPIISYLSFYIHTYDTLPLLLIP
jgi:hypothetical protein